MIIFHHQSPMMKLCLLIDSWENQREIPDTDFTINHHMMNKIAELRDKYNLQAMKVEVRYRSEDTIPDTDQK